MKRITFLLLIIIALVFPMMAVASDTSLATYMATVMVSNNSTAATNVAVPFTLSTPDSAAAGYIDTNCTRVAMTDMTDVPFMPGYGTNPWVIWVPSIGSQAIMRDSLYTSNVSLSSTKYYFPDSTGMSVADTPALEPSSNFSLSLSGCINIDPTATNPIITKPGALDIMSWSGGSIYYGIYATDSQFTTNYTNSSSFANPTYAYDNNLSTAATKGLEDYDSSGYLYLNTSSFTSPSISAYVAAAEMDTSVSLDIYYSGGWHNAGGGTITTATWISYSTGTAASITGVRVSFTNLTAYYDTVYWYDWGVNSSTSVAYIISGGTAASSGEHTIQLLCFANYASNSSFETGNPPSDWILSGAGSSVIRQAGGAYDSYEALVQRNGTDCILYQNLPNPTSYQGKTITLGCKVVTAAANRAVISIGDGYSVASSSYHSGSGNFEWLTVTMTVNPAAAIVQLQLRVENGDILAGFDGAILSVASTLPNQYYNYNLYVDSTIHGSALDNGSLSVLDTSSNWQIGSSATPYITSCNITVGGALQGSWQWEYGATFTDLSGNGHTATPSFRTTSSNANVSASISSFVPLDTAIAPSHAVTAAQGQFYDDTIRASGNFSTANTSSGGPPVLGNIDDIADSGGIPRSFLWGLIACLAFASSGLGLSYARKRYGIGGGYVFTLLIIGVAIFGLLIAFHKFDWWMLWFYIIIAGGIAMASRHIDWGGATSQHSIIGFLAMSWVGLTLINRIMEGAFITSSETAFLNTITFTKAFSLLNLFTIPIMNWEFFTTGIPSLLKWDYSFFGGQAQIIQYLLYSITAVVSFIIFGIILGLVYSAITRSA